MAKVFRGGNLRRGVRNGAGIPAPCCACGSAADAMRDRLMGKRDFFKQERFAKYRFQAKAKTPLSPGVAYERSKEVETFVKKQGREALCQCWKCNKVQLLDPDKGSLRLSCRACGSSVEILTIDGVNQ